MLGAGFLERSPSGIPLRVPCRRSFEGMDGVLAFSRVFRRGLGV